MTLTRRERRRAQAALVVVVIVGAAAMTAVSLGNEPVGWVLAGAAVVVAFWTAFG